MDFNFWLIFGLQKDPQNSSGLKITRQSLKQKLCRLGSQSFVVNILLFSLLMPVSTEASVFSFISSFFSSVQAEQESFANSQNMVLLQSHLSPNQDTFSTKGEISIVGGNSLSPETITTTSKDLKTIDEDQISLYVVHNGDTLPAIAKMFGVSVNTIRWGNDLKGNTLTVGQTLVILPISGIEHVVKSGDTLQSIAKQHKGDLNEILQYNNLTKDSKLAIGDTIIVPDGEASSVSSLNTKYLNIGVGRIAPSYPVYDGFYMRPIIGGIKTQGIHGHNGVDLASSFGANILASASGQVIISKDSGWNGGYGAYIVVSHDNGTQTLYAHLSQALVSVGDSVAQGQIIGKMGRTGRATGVHLHFEIRGARNPF